jgi:hypothetical protein
MKYDHPNIQVEVPVRGYVIISGYPASSHFVEGVGHYTAPGVCIIPPGIPADLLRVIADEREAKSSLTRGAVAVSAVADEVNAELEVSLNVRVLNVLAEGNIKLSKLAERLGVTAEDLKVLDAASRDWHVAQGGWVKLGKKEGEA